MNQQELIQSILIKEQTILLYEKELMSHKRYFSHLNWNKISNISLLTIPFLIGIKIGNSAGKKRNHIGRYAKFITFTIFSHFQNKVLASGYAHLEQLIKNKLAK